MEDTPHDLVKAKAQRMSLAIAGFIPKNTKAADEHGCVMCADTFTHGGRAYVLEFRLKPYIASTSEEQ